VRARLRSTEASGTPKVKLTIAGGNASTASIFCWYSSSSHAGSPSSAPSAAASARSDAT